MGPWVVLRKSERPKGRRCPVWWPVKGVWVMFLISGLLGLLVAGVSIGLAPATGSQEPGDGAAPDDAAQDTPPPAPVSDTIAWGGAEGDVLSGDVGDDQLNGYAGEDRLDGGPGHDVLVGAADDDVILGGAGDDTLIGEDGDDLLEGGAGNDLLAGHFGDDTLEGGAGNDSLIGGAGADLLRGGPGDDTLEGAAGDDTLDGGAGADELFGGAGDDWITGLSDEDEADAPDLLNGGEGADILLAGPGDWVHGGEGGDLFAIADWDGADTPARITDFNPAEDRIAIVWDGDAPVPDLTVEIAGADMAVILLNGAKIAEVLNAPQLTAGDLLIMPQGAFAR